MKTSVMVFAGMTMFLDGSYQGDHMMQSGWWRGETENLVTNEVIFNCLAFPYMLLYTSLYGAMTGSISIVQRYEKCPFHPLEEGATTYTVNFCTWWGTGPDVSPDFVLIFCWWNKSLVTHNGIRLTPTLTPNTTHPILPLFLTQTALSPFYTSSLHQPVHKPYWT